jgi:hypothetical protein
VAEAREPDTVLVTVVAVEIVVLRPVCPEFAREEKFGDDQAAAGGPGGNMKMIGVVGRVVVVVGLGSHGAEEVRVKDAGKTGVGAQEDECVGEREEEW